MSLAIYSTALSSPLYTLFLERYLSQFLEDFERYVGNIVPVMKKIVEVVVSYCSVMDPSDDELDFGYPLMLILVLWVGSIFSVPN